MFKVGDRVVDIWGRGEGTVTSIRAEVNYPIETSFGETYTTTGKHKQSDNLPSLKHVGAPTDHSTERITGLATIITLSDGTRIYHPDQGQPFILPTRTLL